MRYVIIGNGVAGTTAAFTIRERERRAWITLISDESDYFISRTALMYAFMDRLERRDLEPVERKVWDRQNIECVRGRVTGIDSAGHKLTMRSGAVIPYDRLLIACGSLPNRPAWDGLAEVQDGLVNFVTLGDLDRCERLTKTGQKAVVVGGGLIGVELVECLRHHGMQVTFLVREPWYWPAALGKPEGLMISEHIRKHGVDVRMDESVKRVNVDSGGNVRGVLTDAGHEYACSLLGVAVGVHPAIEWLPDNGPRANRGVLVDTSFRTSLDTVWAAGDCAEIQFDDRPTVVEQIWYSAKRQGELAARSMLGDPIVYDPPVFYNSAKLFDIEYTTVGNFRIPDAAEFYGRIPGRDVSIRIAEYSGAVIGFNMLGSRWDHTWFERWIAERRSLEYVMEQLHLAQFDVEFGRQDLSEFRRQFAKWPRGAPAVVA